MTQPAPGSRARADLVARYRRNRARSRQLFALLSDEAYYSQPIALRHPIVFYEGHLPGFSFNTLVKKALGRSSIDARLEHLFARGIDPDESAAARPDMSDPERQWPSREVVHAFAEEADRLVIDALEHADLDRPGHPLLDRSEAVFAIFEHEEMHHETLLYMWHRLPFAQKTAPEGYQPRTEGALAPAQWVHVPAGRATLGVDRDRDSVWLGQRMSGVVGRCAELRDRAARCDQRAVPRVRGRRRLPRRAVVDTRRLAVASDRRAGASSVLGASRIGLVLARDVRVDPAAGIVARVRQSGGSVCVRTVARRAPPDGGASSSAPPMDPRKASGRTPGAAMPRSLVTACSTSGAGTPSQPAAILMEPARGAWRTSSAMGGNGRAARSRRFPDFARSPSYPEYSADFFDGEHFVMKGASPATVRDLLRPTFRNWFRKRYPYVYATFRCAKSE